jgi:hypothetical protein
MLNDLGLLHLDYDRLVNEFNELDLENKLLQSNKQICIQRRHGVSGDVQYFEGAQSLMIDWEGYDPSLGTEPPKRTEPLKEKDFNEITDMFEGTYIGEVTSYLHKEYNVVRGRFMLSEWKTCLTYHTDPTPRLHIPIVTNDNCFMVVDDKVIRLPFGATYIVDTTLPHTAINASRFNRTHMVFCLP